MAGQLPVPTVARVRSITHWNRFFHPQHGMFRAQEHGRFIEYLDIDVRFVDPAATSPTDTPSVPVQLPNVVVVTLRAGQDEENYQRMKCLVEVLGALEPCEVRWLGSSDESIPSKSHFVHPLIVELGRTWSGKRCLQRLVIQGGFPCTNETESYFDKRLSFAFGSWVVARTEWDLDQHSTTAALGIIQSYLQSINIGDGSSHCLPVALAFSTKSSDIVLRLRDVLQVSPIRLDITKWLEDSTFHVLHGCASRIWYEEPDCQTRLLARLRAELFIAQDYPIIPSPHMPDIDLEAVRTP